MYNSHPKRKLLADMDKTQLLAMRDEGMTYSEIAGSVGCSITTVSRILGPMPPDMLKERKSRGGSRGAASKWSKTSEGGYTVERKMKSFMPQPEAQEQERTEAVLAVKSAPVLLSGAFMSYAVSADRKMIDVETQEGRALMQIPAERLGEFIKELTVIGRNIDRAKAMEFWG